MNQYALSRQPPMFTIPKLYSPARNHADILEVENLAKLVLELGPPPHLEKIIAEQFERIVELVGCKEFLPAFSELQAYLLNVKFSREGYFLPGTIVPWPSPPNKKVTSYAYGQTMDASRISFPDSTY